MAHTLTATAVRILGLNKFHDRKNTSDRTVKASHYSTAKPDPFGARPHLVAPHWWMGGRTSCVTSAPVAHHIKTVKTSKTRK